MSGGMAAHDLVAARGYAKLVMTPGVFCVPILDSTPTAERFHLRERYDEAEPVYFEFLRTFARRD